MKVLAIDPGNELSAYCIFDGHTFVEFGKMPNSDLENKLYELNRTQRLFDQLYIEGIQSFGLAVGATVFLTAYQIGRLQVILENLNQPYKIIHRSDVKTHHCHSMRAKDTNIRQALIGRFGAPGTKKAPGGTYGIKADIWSAAAIAVMCYDHLQANLSKTF